MINLKKNLHSAVDIPILAVSVLGMALLAIGIAKMAPTGEQSKLAYEDDLWCVSNYIEARNSAGEAIILKDGRPRQDELLDGKEDWIVRDQVQADTKEEAEKIARENGKGRFEPSNQDELREKLKANDKEFFTTHFNEGATMAGPCWGTGSTTSQTGRWLNDAINDACGFNTASGYETVPGKPTQAVITAYSPNIPSIGNICDAKKGGQNTTADGGSFKVIDGRLRYVKGSTAEDYVFAQPADDPIIDWDKIEDQAVILEGFNNNQPIHIRDHYEPGNHEGHNYLDLFLPCGSEYSGFVQSKTRKITVVDLTKPKPQDQKGLTKTLPDGTPCPTEPLPSGPSAGEDYRAKIAEAFEKELSEKAAEESAGDCEFDEAAEKAIVDEAMKYAPGTDGKTKYKYKEDGNSPSSGFDCSGFVHYVLKKVKGAGADVSLGSDSHTSNYKNVGQVIDKIDPAKFINSKRGARLRTKSDMVSTDNLRPGDILFFGTASACTYSGLPLTKCPNTIGHMGIYIGDGKYIHSTTSDKILERDSKSRGNNTSTPIFSPHPDGSQYADYNGVKIDKLDDSYFTPGLYIQVNRVTKKKDCGGAYGGVYGTVAGLGTTAYPGGEGATPNFKSYHGNSACIPEKRITHHGVYKNSGSGDALDITPQGGIARAVFDGTATHGGSGRDSYTLVTSANGKVRAYYYHTINLKNGSVKAGDAIAKVGAGNISHIHFELLVDGKSVNGDRNLCTSPSKYQASLWKNMKIVLGLP